ncbi:hypothetical protein MMSR116_18175 [Methylobacterium mesophilicum SR1.6/6]|uniref:Uncharacterized protein n=1 Tax=Methylobacterium mesophilicum SR1.6/6 TaxID=908290 RepID=A0A6B9FP06_9HYPH|nr:hypothetical protein [Methylobacterium mesophilicum]QGY03599.1 hypothetical protein MMSR116_18175 [Methylobacterium mesophilicum SR1.6/6]
MSPDEIIGFVKARKVNELLELHGAVIEELRERKIVRSANGPIGDYAEFLFAKAFGWTLVNNSKKDTMRSMRTTGPIRSKAAASHLITNHANSVRSESCPKSISIFSPVFCSMWIIPYIAQSSFLTSLSSLDRVSTRIRTAGYSDWKMMFGAYRPRKT